MAGQETIEVFEGAFRHEIGEGGKYVHLLTYLGCCCEEITCTVSDLRKIAAACITMADEMDT